MGRKNLKKVYKYSNHIAVMSVRGGERGQITIFIIVGVLIVSGIILFFLYRTNLISNIGIGGRQEANVNAFLNSCLEEKTKEAVRELSIRGGELNPKLSINFLFTGEEDYRNISYLCYTQNNFRPCVAQKPAIILDMQNGIKDYISDDVESCFQEMLSDFKSKGFDVGSDSELRSFEVKLMPRRILIQTNSEVILTKSDETTTQKNFEIAIQSRVYELLGIVQEIINGEAQFCYFEDTGFEVAYPEFLIDKFNVESGNYIYTIENIDSREKFRFAIRSCGVPPGF